MTDIYDIFREVEIAIKNKDKDRIKELRKLADKADLITAEGSDEFFESNFEDDFFDDEH